MASAPGDLAVGKRWRSAFVNTNPSGGKTSNFYDFKVVAFEEITVPAGRFMAYKVERSGEARSQDTYTVLTGTAWIDPTTMYAVRNDTMFRSGGKITAHWSDVLVSARRALRPTVP